MEWISDFGGKKQPVEKTVVRPAFSYMGEFTIADSVLCDLCRIAAKTTENVAEVVAVSVPKKGHLYMEITVTGTHIKATADAAVHAALQSVEQHTGMGFSEITCYVLDYLD